MPVAGKPIVYVIDDDPVFNKLMDHVLRKFGLNLEIFTDPDQFLAAVKRRVPSLCLIDLNLVTPHRGFEMVETIRSQHSRTVPIFIVSTEEDRSSVAFAVQLGANEYLFKPLNREVLISKLSNYLKTPELEVAQLGTEFSPDSTIQVRVKLDVKLAQVDETGITVLSKHLVPAGTVISLSGPILEELCATAAPVLFTATANEAQAVDGYFRTYLEFNPAQEGLSNQVRSWIQKRLSIP